MYKPRSCYLDALKALQILCFFIIVCIAQSSFAQNYAMDSEEGVAGEELFIACAFCHGPQGQGGPAVDAPPLAGMDAWYVERQLQAFRSRIRGAHPDDVPGLQMSIVSGMTRNNATIKNIANYVSQMETGAPAELYYGEPITNKNRNYIWESQYAVLNHSEPADVAAGKELYTTYCLVCHAADGVGNQALGAPKITLLPDWYIHRQLQYFKNNIRGNDARDIYGAQMAAFSKLLPDNQAIADVTAYVLTLGESIDDE